MTAMPLTEPVTFKPQPQVQRVNYEPSANSVVIGDRAQLHILSDEGLLTLTTPVPNAMSRSASTPQFNIGAVVFLLVAVACGLTDLVIGRMVVSGTVLGMLAFASVWLWLTGVIAHRNRGRDVA